MPTTIPLSRLTNAEGLNVGSGPHYAEGWVNIDAVPAPEGCRDPDLLVDIFGLGAAFPPRVFRGAYVGHVLEHLDWEDVQSALQVISSRVIEGGAIMVVGPCIHRAIETRQPRHIIEAILADPRESGPWAHSWTPTTELTVEAMRPVLEGVREVPISMVKPPAWPNPSTASWQVAVLGFAR